MREGYPALRQRYCLLCHESLAHDRREIEGAFTDAVVCANLLTHVKYLRAPIDDMKAIIAKKGGEVWTMSLSHKACTHE